MSKVIKFKCEFETPQLRFASMICPYCNEKFNAMEYGKTESGGNIYDSIDLEYGIFICPNCKEVIKTRDEYIKIESE